jgi:hypothetical protein
MTVHAEKPSQPLWQAHTEQWLKPLTVPAAAASFDQANEDNDPDPPRGAPAARAWPRVFPGL